MPYKTNLEAILATLNLDDTENDAEFIEDNDAYGYPISSANYGRELNFE